MHFSFPFGELIDIYYKLDYVYINKYSLSSPIHRVVKFSNENLILQNEVW